MSTTSTSSSTSSTSTITYLEEDALEPMGEFAGTF